MSKILLRGGHKTADPRLDRIPQFDERSRQFPIRKLVGDKKPRSYTWKPGVQLDQGSEGACVGFGWAHELAARPTPILRLNDSYARNRIYKEAQKIDEWAGEDYEGTSVIAGAKVVESLGFMREYRWGFSVEDVILALGYQGCVVFGLYWYSGMFNTDEKGFIRPTGYLAGGHCITGYGVNIKEEYIKLQNSWGSDWGENGTCKMSFEDLRRLLREDGESCIPVKRIKKEVS